MLLNLLTTLLDIPPVKSKHRTLFLLAGAGVAYYLYQKSQTPAVVSVPPAVVPTTGVSGFGLAGGMGYFPSGADRPFARMTMPGAGMPFARASHGVPWY